MSNGGGVARWPRALVVEDEDTLRAVLQDCLTALGYVTEGAADGQAALRQLARSNYDVVICDLVMPHMGGDELLRACLERMPETARRFVFVTASPPGTAAHDYVVAEGRPLLPKPFRLSELRAALDALASASAPA